MPNVQLGNKAIGDIVKLNVDGVARNFIVVHQGLPSNLYDESCDGTWLLMEDIYETRPWSALRDNNYANSDIYNYLNNDFFDLFDADIQMDIKQVKIPYCYDAENDSVAFGSDGLPARVFQLSGSEVGWLPGNYSGFRIDGTCLSYFNGLSERDAKRIGYLNGSVKSWGLRSASNSASVWIVDAYGGRGGSDCPSPQGIRPALILSHNLSVSDDGSVRTNTAPAIVCTPASWADLGVKGEGFSITYSASDADSDHVTVTEAIDGVTLRTFTPGAEESCTFALTGETFMKLLNGAHTLAITASDGQAQAVHTLTFTKSVTAASITLAQPMEADGPITLCVLSVTGSIPEDADYSVKVTNNALDDAPVWEDCTDEVKLGANYVFTNDTAANGFAFNFKVEVERGESSQGGYINSVQGGFQ